MDIAFFLKRLATTPTDIEFSDTMAIIKDNFFVKKSAFSNGTQVNAADENLGSCQIFSFAQLYDLTPEATLNCFGKYYREDVLLHPLGQDHQNIRQFMINGWSGIAFSATALTLK